MTKWSPNGYTAGAHVNCLSAHAGRTGSTSDGVLQAGSLLPPNVSHFKVLLVTLETQAKPHGPGKTVLKGPITLR